MNNCIGWLQYRFSFKCDLCLQITFAVLYKLLLGVEQDKLLGRVLRVPSCALMSSYISIQFAANCLGVSQDSMLHGSSSVYNIIVHRTIRFTDLHTKICTQVIPNYSFHLTVLRLILLSNYLRLLSLIFLASTAIQIGPALVCLAGWTSRWAYWMRVSLGHNLTHTVSTMSYSYHFKPYSNPFNFTNGTFADSELIFLKLFYFYSN